MKQIFLISGKAQHGKTSIAQFLSKKIPGKGLILHHADYLKFIAKNYLDWNGEKDVFGRCLLQKLGTEKTKIKLNKPLFWTELLCNTIEILQDDFDYFYIADVRFKSEIYYPLSRYGNIVLPIRVERLNFDNGLTFDQKNHLSEIDLDDFEFDYIINSKSGLNYLEEEVDKYIKWYLLL